MTPPIKYRYFLMRLSRQELRWVQQNLITQRMYRNTNIPCRAVIWEPWKEAFFKKINDELELL